MSFQSPKTGPVEGDVRKAIQQKYTDVSVSSFGKFQYPVGKEGADRLGYDRTIVETAPKSLLESFCGVGNPFSLGTVVAGASVLDVGCGAGFDLYVASKLVGESGRLCGIDLTEAMVKQARKNLEQAAITNFEVKNVDSELIPYGDQTFDVVISNGVLNLSFNKEISFREINRVLKSGGRLQFADVVLVQELPEGLAGSPEAWSQ